MLPTVIFPTGKSVFLIADDFLYSPHLSVWEFIDIVTRNCMLVTKLAGKLNRLIVNWPMLHLFTFVPNRISISLISESESV